MDRLAGVVRIGIEEDLDAVVVPEAVLVVCGTSGPDLGHRAFEAEDVYVHSLSKKVEDDLESGDMERRVASIFNEKD